MAGHGGEAPAWYEIFLGQATVIGQAANRIRTTFNGATGKLDHRQLYHAAEIVGSDGKKYRQITIDARDKDQIPTIIRRERKRHGLPPLTDEEMAAASVYTTTEVTQPLVMVNIPVSFDYVRHAMLKIAYELAFLWLGDDYLFDPLAIELRGSICDPNTSSTNEVEAFIGEAQHCQPFTRFWLPHEAHHLAYATLLLNQSIVVNIRIFDIYAASVIVSRDPARYIRNADDNSKMRFLAVDSQTGRAINTSFADESKRIALAMSECRRPPPFADPLDVQCS